MSCTLGGPATSVKLMVLPPRWIGVGRIARRQRIVGLRRLQRLVDHAAIDADIGRGVIDPGARLLEQRQRPRAHHLDAEILQICASRPDGSPRSGRPTAAPSADRDWSRAFAAVAGWAAGPLLLVRSAPRLRLGSFMRGIKAPANKAGCQKYAVCGRDFSQGGISASAISYKSDRQMSKYQSWPCPERSAERSVNGRQQDSFYDFGLLLFQCVGRVLVKL